MPDTLTWAALLGRWTDFAAASVALPESGEPGRWKQAVGHVISLQAVTHALGEIVELELVDLPLAIDRAALAVREGVLAIQAIWGDQALAPQAAEICDDAELALALAESFGIEWAVESETWTGVHPGELAEALAESGLVAKLLVPTPGVPLYGSSPCAHLVPTRWDEESIGAVATVIEAFFTISGSVGPAMVGPQRQVYRQFDFSRGGPVSDLVVPTALGVVSGQPLLVPAIVRGEACPVTLPPRRSAKFDPLPVHFVESQSDLAERTT